jgi:hypothetical protein
MPEPDELAELLRRSQFVFEATVQQHQQATMSDVDVGPSTVVVRIDQVLQAPAALSRAAGSRATVQLLEGEPVPAIGERLTLFTSAVAFGEGIVLAEVGRAEPETLGEVAVAAGAPAAVPGARPGRPHPVLETAQRLDDERLRAHMDDAAAVVIGRVVALERVGPAGRSEHDADWWRATIQVEHVEKGDVPDQVQVVFANSTDTHWARLPKLRAGEEGLWLLHATDEDQADLAPFMLRDTDDAHPADHLDRLRTDA